MGFERRLCLRETSGTSMPKRSSSLDSAHGQCDRINVNVFICVERGRFCSLTEPRILVTHSVVFSPFSG